MNINSLSCKLLLLNLKNNLIENIFLTLYFLHSHQMRFMFILIEKNMIHLRKFNEFKLIEYIFYKVRKCHFKFEEFTEAT